MKTVYGSKKEEPPWGQEELRENFFCAEEIDSLPFAEMGPVVVMNDPFDSGVERIYPNPYSNGISVIGSFREYLMGHFYNDYKNYLHSLLADSRLPIGKYGRYITAPERIGIGEIDVIRIDLYKKSSCEVYADIIMIAYLTLYDHLGTRLIQENISQWYRVRTVSNLSPDNLSFNEIEFAAVYDRNEPLPGMALDDYLVPYTRTEFMDSESTDILLRYYPEVLETPAVISGEELAKRMKLNIKYCRLAGNGSIRGQMYFEEHTIDVLDKNNRVCHKRIPANTIVVDISSLISEEMDLKKELLNDTVIHECYHADRHRLFYLGQRLYNEEIRCLSCSIPGIQNRMQIDNGVAFRDSPDIDTAVLGDAMLSAKSPIDWIEWQADRATPRIRMPAATTEAKINELYNLLQEKYPHMSREKLTANVVIQLADFFGVSKQSARLRMIELGYSEAQGVLNFANGAYVESHSFTPGVIEKNQTFTIDILSARELFSTNEAFRKRISSGCYQYIDGHYCLAKPQYIYKRNGILKLTSYAKSHMDECCLVFTIESGRAGYGYKEGTLQKEAVISTSRAGYSDKQPSAFDYQNEASRLSQILYSLPPNPSGTLIKHMERKKITLEGLVAKSGVSISTIKRLRSSDSCRTNRNNILAICIGLQLEPLLQKDYLRKCGVSFNQSQEDILYELMMCSMYRLPLSEFNRKLEEYGLPPLSKGVDELDS